MAKVGEGDPRWLVSNRKDGKNVGNWHWEEKNLLPLTKQKTEELFMDLQLSPPDYQNRIVLVKPLSVSGDAVLNIRKGRSILIYDLTIKLKWDCPTLKHTGEIKIWDLTQDNNDDNNFKYNVTSDKQDVTSTELVNILSTSGKEIISKKILLLLEALRNVDSGIPVADILQAAHKLRLAGNELFKTQKFAEAIVKYGKALATLSTIRPNAAESEETNQAKVSCFLNKATCSLKLNKNRDAIVDCSKALEIDANNIKALFKRSQAYCSLKEFEEAKRDINLAAKLNPSDKEVQAQLTRVNQLYVSFKKKQQQTMSGMFRNLY
eukprot:TRINITY_DN8708_c0_g1_i1.p1 TRINITY_DN8708_c0_g1~~TRINITY_DN8708_c0_g1_i1.p1  ORF type:complete len:321 (-),score=59.62 TRINITY_DN8708_c0_g1_i1:36-998(-)